MLAYIGKVQTILVPNIRYVWILQLFSALNDLGLA